MKLRQKGMSMPSIAKHLNISKSTVSLWSRSVVLTQKQKEILIQNSIDGRNRGRIIGADRNRKKKQERVDFFKKEGMDKFKKISRRELELVSAALYWAEGAKTESRFMFVNSDPRMIKIIYTYLIKILLIPKKRIKPVVQINQIHKYRIGLVLKFWSDLLGLPTSSFGNTYYVKTSRKKIYDNHNSYHGVLRLSVSRSSDYQYKILGIISAIICRGSSGG